MSPPSSEPVSLHITFEDLEEGDPLYATPEYERIYKCLHDLTLNKCRICKH